MPTRPDTLSVTAPGPTAPVPVPAPEPGATRSAEQHPPRRPSDLVQSVSRALAVLEAVGRGGGALSAKAIARRTGLNLSTTYHLLHTLCWEGYLVRLDNGDYRLGAVTLSAQMLAVVRRLLAGEAVEQGGSGLSKREWRELMEQLGRPA